MSKNPDPDCRCCKGFGTYPIHHGPVLGDEFVTCECTEDPDTILGSDMADEGHK